MVTVASKAASSRVALWQNVQTPATHELLARKCHLLRLITAAPGRADPRSECHLAVLVTHDAAIGNREVDKGDILLYKRTEVD